MIGTNEFINQCKQDKISYREYIVIDDVPIDVKAQTYFTAYKDTTFFGTFNLNYIKFKTQNNIDYKNKDFTYFKEVNGVSQQIGHYYVTEVIDNDTEEEIEITAFDNGIKFNNKYVTSLNYHGGNVTLFDVLEECCIKCSILLENESITNGSFGVDSNQFDENATYGDVICAIAQMAGCFAFINYKGKLELRFTNTTNEVIEDYVELEDKRDTQPITSVLIGLDPDIEGEYAVREDSSLVEQYGRNWLKIYGNPFSYTPQKREQLIDAIFNQVKGFGYSAFTSKDCFAPYFELGDLIQFKNKNGDNISSIILRIETEYDEVTVSAPSITNAEIDYIMPTSDNEMARNTKLQVDKQKQEISAVILNVGEQNTKIAEITATVDELNSKISDIADITTSRETDTGFLNFTDINASEPITVKIHPTVYSIAYTYPSTGLFPSNNTFLKTRTLRFNNTKTSEIFDYELPCDLYYYDEENYDEFILDYDSQTCQVNKKVGVNADGTTYLLVTPTIITYDYPSILLTDGDYTVSLLGYEAGYLFVRLMTQNIYTTQFATRVEMNSAISQKADQINLSVDYKLTAYPTTTEMNSAINLSANSITNSVRATYATKETTNTIEAKLELKVNTDDLISEINASADRITLTSGRLIITSGNFQLDDSGNITCNGGKIAGWTITNDSLDSATTGMSNGHYYAFYVKTGNETPFYVTLSGDLQCKTLLINGAPTMKTSGEGGKQVINYYVDGNQLITTTENSIYVVLPDSIISDRDKKKNIKETEINGLNIIKNMDFVQFDWKGNGDHEAIGVISQDVEKICKDLTTDITMPDGSKSKIFNNSRMIFVNAKAIQELHQEIQELKERIK